jgi:hypothetical protein
MLFASDRAPLVRRPTAAVQKSGAYGDEGKAASRPLTVLAALLSAPFGASATTLAAWRCSPRSLRLNHLASFTAARLLSLGKLASFAT